MRTRTSCFLLLLALFWGCTKEAETSDMNVDVDQGQEDDLGEADQSVHPDLPGQIDLSMPADQSTSSDLSTSDDLSTQDDLSMAADLRMPADMSMPPDLSKSSDMSMPPDLSAPDMATNCSGPLDCTLTKPYCCGKLELGGGVPPNCPIKSVTIGCEASCSGRIPLACPGMGQTRLCKASADCVGDPGNYRNCCQFTAGTTMVNICVPDIMKAFATKCFL